MDHPSIPELFEQAVIVDAPAEHVWACLTRPELMKEWMGEPEMALEIEASWVVGTPIVMRGFHHAPFRNVGTVLEFNPTSRLSYTHLSSLSRLPDEPASYTTLDFRLDSTGDTTSLKLVASGFPTASIFRHLQFYWGGTLEILKQTTERRLSDQTAGDVPNTSSKPAPLRGLTKFRS